VSYYLYVYSPSDFVGGLPDEVGAEADGAPTFVLTLKADAVPTLIEVTDDDKIFDEVDATQSVTTDVAIDGTKVAAGTTINTAYDLLNSTNGHKVTSFHFGGDGYQQGPVDGIVSTVPLKPGESYKFDSERTSHQQDNPYSDYVACFTKGCLIETITGMVTVEDLSVGDLVKTRDNGYQPIRWIGGRSVAAIGKMAPIVFAKGVIGNRRELVVSPEHRVLIEDARVELLFAEDAVLVAAKHLVDGDRIYRRTGGDVTYYHFMFDQHQIVYSEGVASESFLPEQAAMGGLLQNARQEVLAIFPELQNGTGAAYSAAARCLRQFESVLLA